MRSWLAGWGTVLLAMTSVPVAHAACRGGAIETRHSARIGGRPFAYIACAGTLPVRDDSGTVRGSIFYTYYTLPKASASRPVSFIWNGGPPSDSRLLHLHALGPRVIRDGKLVDNPVSLLSASDLVFVDPIGTAFSTPATPDDAKRFSGTMEDIDATTRFIVSFRTTYERSRSSLYLIGESFGTWRATGVAEALIDRKVPVSGVVLISGGIPLGDRDDRSLIRALSVPNRTATAFTLKRLPPDLQADRVKALAEVENWARSTYRGALANPDALSDAGRQKIIAEIARYHGLDPSAIDPKTLWVSPRDFRTKLIPGKTLDVFDMRKIGGASEGGEGPIALAYFRNELGYKAGAYAGLDAGTRAATGDRWQYDQAPITPESLKRAMAGEGPPSPSQPWTLRALEKERTLRVWVAAGQYDSLNSCAGNIATVANLPSDAGRRITLNCYPGGHMMYQDPAATIPFARDLAHFVR